MSRTLCIVMDPITGITVKKDSSFAMLLAAKKRGWQLYYLEMADLSLRDGQAWGRRRAHSVRDDPEDWFTLGAPEDQAG